MKDLHELIFFVMGIIFFFQYIYNTWAYLKGKVK